MSAGLILDSTADALPDSSAANVVISSNDEDDSHVIQQLDGEQCSRISSEFKDMEQDDDSSESDSICTTIARQHQDLDYDAVEKVKVDGLQEFNSNNPTSTINGDAQILSANNLILSCCPATSSAQINQEDSNKIFHEIDLDEGAKSSDESPGKQVRGSVEREADEMFAVYRQQDEDRNFQFDDKNNSQMHQQTAAAANLTAENMQQQQQFTCNGFSGAPPKITFASRRVKQYFETFRSHKGETVRLYQFFKSTRTELVACLLFSLITSQALIVLRTHLIDDDSGLPPLSAAPVDSPIWPLDPATLQRGDVSASAVTSQDNVDLVIAGGGSKESPTAITTAADIHNHLYHRGQISNSNRPQTPTPLDNGPQVASRRAGAVHLAHGLVVAFTVASLTQIFGHISGCHLIPSVSLALYVKGHISRARLASYLAAQLLGSALGVSLLSLLSSSQLTTTDYRELILQRYPAAVTPAVAAFNQQPTVRYHQPSFLAESVQVQDLVRLVRRKRRDVASFEPRKLEQAKDTAVATKEVAAESDADSGISLSNGDEYQGSETILLSIMEQLERQQQRAPANDGLSDRKRDSSVVGREQLQEQFGEHDAKRIASSMLPPPPNNMEKTITFSVNTFLNNGSDAVERVRPPRSYLAIEQAAPRAQFEQPSERQTTNSTTVSSPLSNSTAATAEATTTVAAAATTIVHETATPTIAPPPTTTTAKAATAAALGRSNGWNYSELDAGSFAGEGREVPRLMVASQLSSEQSSSNDRSRVVSSTVATSIERIVAGDASSSALAAAVSTAALTSDRQAAPWGGSQWLNPNQELQQDPHVVGGRQLQDTVSTTIRPKLRRRKRNKQQQQSVTPQTPPTSSASNQTADRPVPIHGPEQTDQRWRKSDHYINLLEFALPDQIMSRESIRQCIDKQQQLSSANQTVVAGNQRNLQQRVQLASDSFNNCISLSNSSQMFVFQFLATLLVVLAYLVNVDPRRVDPGFKSLSIGLAYFVASVVTVQSGGFHGNPFHLVFLSWLSATTEWRPEWFVYLVTPLIGGLFAAISHEYIDFSSLRNRDKRLHLRRSFYSLDNLASSAQNYESRSRTQRQNSDTLGENQQHQQHACLEMCGLRLHQTPGSSVVRQLSSSSSLESAGATSSVLSFSSHHDLQQQQQQQASLNIRPPQPQPRTSECFNGASTTSRTAKLARYPRPPRVLDQQLQQQKSATCIRQNGQLSQQQVLVASASQQQSSATMMQKAAAPKQEAQGASLRRSDFDSNFLISSAGGAQTSSSLSSASTASPTPPPQPPPTAIRRQLTQAAAATSTADGWM